ncbi:VanZ family protein [Nocardia huaxiensis]|uniref:VanZ family protein n=1 Tax=Nocardia huaxiensis TaxID=2755382 RepID=A0A7D6VD26_9NOCA|nr:VanZ family protein [Nocardia huaxiensis]QLY29495.1 VanZ family protein [Nocardia huaxiensis]UFS96949.1 VanZ family protein [Nocardia huaxiensis]
MNRVWEMWGGVLVAWALAIPVLTAAVYTGVRWRIGRGTPRETAVRHTVAEAGILGGTLPWIWMILTPVNGVREISWVPLRDLVATLTDSASAAVVQVGANLILFVPLGFLLPLRFPRFAGAARMFAVGALISATLEIAQYALDIGRVSSVDDVLMNATGAAVGAALAGMRGPASNRTDQPVPIA